MRRFLFRLRLAPILVALALATPARAGAQGTVVVRADNPPIWGDVRLEERAVIGTLDGPEEYVFGDAFDAVIAADSTVLVLDLQVPVIRRYSLDGRYLGDVGREGGGPGEYRRPVGIAPLPDGRLGVWDPRGGRVSIFESDGSFSRSFQVRSGFFGYDVFHADRRGRVYVKALARSGSAQEDVRYAWLRYSSSGEFLDTIPVPPKESGPAYVLATPEGYRAPFITETVAALSSGGYLVEGRTDEYALFRPLPSGEILRIERSYTPVEITGAERRQWEAFNHENAGMARRMEMDDDWPSIPRVKPPFRSFFVDQDGRIWVSMYAEAYEAEFNPEYLAEHDGKAIYRWREPPVWEVIDADGRFLGRVTLPTGSLPMTAKGDWLITVRHGEWDEAYVVVNRIAKESGS